LERINLIKFLIRKFIKDYENVDDKDVREKYGVLSGVLGIICNLILFSLKLFVGLLINSIAVISDAFNNITDLGSSVVTIFGSKLSNRPPDEGHPHGHGRYEYIAPLVIAFIIFGVGLETFRTSIEKIVNPERIEFNFQTGIILIFSILIKLWMYSYNKYIGEKINSSANKATAHDSLNDVIATSSVLLGMMLEPYVSFPVDGILGLLISIVIIYSAFSIAKDSVSLLLGSSPDPELVDKIERLILENSNIKGIHRLIVHDYGPNKIMASVHAEVSSKANIVDIHSEVDRIEKRIKDELNVDIVIHMDPIENHGMEDNQKTN